MPKYLEFDTPAGKQAGDLCSYYKLSNHGLLYLDRVFWNLPAAALSPPGCFSSRSLPPLSSPTPPRLTTDSSPTTT